MLASSSPGRCAIGCTTAMRKVMRSLLRFACCDPTYRWSGPLQRSTAFGGPQLAPDLRDESFQLSRLMGNGRCRAPDRLRPPGIARAPRDHMHMQLRHHIAERRYVELVAGGHLLEGATGERDLGHQRGLLGLVEI